METAFMIWIFSRFFMIWRLKSSYSLRLQTTKWMQIHYFFLTGYKLCRWYLEFHFWLKWTRIMELIRIFKIWIFCDGIHKSKLIIFWRKFKQNWTTYNVEMLLPCSNLKNGRISKSAKYLCMCEKFLLQLH